MSSFERRDRSVMARLAQLSALAETEFGRGKTSPRSVPQLMTLIDDFHSLLAQLRAERDEIGAQLRGSMVGRRADAAYRASAGLARKQNDR